MPPTICLNMIVKDESRVIRRCLESVRPLVQRWVIVDTGSTDGTQDLIREIMRDIPGELHERPWKNFGHNRSEAIAFAGTASDFLLIFDADEKLVPSPGFSWGLLPADEYMIACHYEGGSTLWYRTTLLRASRRWRYEGAVHEFPVCDGLRKTEKLAGIELISHTDGARNADSIQKYANDAHVLEAELVREPNNPRNAYYFAQSLSGAGQTDRAIAAYERRAELEGFYEETWNSLFQAARLKHERGDDWPPVLAAYLRAFQFNPKRAEPLCALATRYRLAQEWALAELFARAAAAIPKPDEIFLVEDSVYEWRAIDELSIATYYVGKYVESEALCRKLLADPKLPASERERVEKNLAFAVERNRPTVQKQKISPNGTENPAEDPDRR